MEKKKYIIENFGCDDTTEGKFLLTEQQYKFLNDIFEKLNKNSTYGCMPKIYIKEIKEKE